MDCEKLVDVVLMQLQKVFHKYSHSDLTAEVLSLESFVLCNNYLWVHVCDYVLLICNYLIG